MLATAQGSSDLNEAFGAVIGTTPRNLVHLCLRSSVTV
jgi:hypothetical protein